MGIPSRVPGAYRPDSLAKEVSSTLSERPYVKKQGRAERESVAGKSACDQDRQCEFNLQSPHGRRKEPVFASCSPQMCNGTCPSTKLNKHTKFKKKKISWWVPEENLYHLALASTHGRKPSEHIYTYQSIN